MLSYVCQEVSEYEDGPYPKNVWPPSHLCGSYWKNFQSWMCMIFRFLSQQIWHCTSKYKTLFPKQTPRNSSNLLPVKNSDIHPAPLSEKKECIFHFMNWKCTSFQVYVSFISFFFRFVQNNLSIYVSSIDQAQWIGCLI